MRSLYHNNNIMYARGVILSIQWLLCYAQLAAWCNDCDKAFWHTCSSAVVTVVSQPWNDRDNSLGTTVTTALELLWQQLWYDCDNSLSLFIYCRTTIYVDCPILLFIPQVAMITLLFIIHVDFNYWCSL